LSCDPHDEFISDNTSLKTAVSKSLIIQFKKERKVKVEFVSKQFTNLLSFVFNPNDMKQFISSIEYITKKIQENKFATDEEKELSEHTPGSKYELKFKFLLSKYFSKLKETKNKRR